MSARILIVDDDPEVVATMASLIRRLKMDHASASNLTEARRALEGEGFDVVLLDVRLPDGDGLSLLPEIKAMDTDGPGAPEVVILTGRGDPDGAELAIREGAWDYLVKPASIKQISLSLNRALTFHRQKTACARRALDLAGVVGDSPAMRRCHGLVAQAAACEASVLVTGETGAGKELIARTVHANSARAGREFVAMDCASLTDSLTESTLFGHVKGAFTGALEARPGLVRLAHRGTLFLDEVGELPLSLQKSFLRVLQERRFRPVGAGAEVESDFRLISATNRDLDAMALAGTFRKDLLFRLKTIGIHIPPLRERGDDIKALALHQCRRLCEKYRLPAKGFSADFFEVLMAYPWPGNVRELFNVLERAVAAAGADKTLYAMHLPSDLRVHVARAQLVPRTEGGGGRVDGGGNGNGHGGAAPSLKEYKEKAEADYLRRLVAENGGEVGAMLATSQLSRSHLYSLLKKHGIKL